MKLWIARGKCGGLVLFNDKPERYEGIFYSESKDMDGTELCVQDLDHEFDFVT